MFRHIVLLKFVDDTSTEQITTIRDELNKLPGIISEIKHYEIGIDKGLADGNASIAVIGDFDSPEAYLVYANHPAHLAVVIERIKPILAQRSAIQFARPN